MAKLATCARCGQDFFRNKKAFYCSLACRFEAKVDRSAGPDGCHVWTGSTNGIGYGSLWCSGSAQRKELAHRIAWELAYGPIPEGEGYHGTCVCHRCDNPACVNPAHLFLGTHLENAADRESKGRGRSPGSPGQLNPKAKLSLEQVLSARALVLAGISRAEIARQWGVCKGTVARAVKGTTWTSAATGKLAPWCATMRR